MAKKHFHFTESTSPTDLKEFVNNSSDDDLIVFESIEGSFEIPKKILQETHQTIDHIFDGVIFEEDE